MSRRRSNITHAAGRQLDGFAGNDGFAPSKLPGRVATREETTLAAVRMPVTTQMAHQVAALAASGLRDIVSDAEARRIVLADDTPEERERHANELAGDIDEPRTPDNLPAVIATAIAQTDGKFNPNWHMVRRLPGYVKEPIRRLGRDLIGAFTTTPIEDIQLVSTISNSETEVRAMMTWIAQHGVRQDKVEVDVGAYIPGYRPEVQKWSAAEFSFLLVKDDYGYYVYGWPRDHDHDLENEYRPAIPGGR